MIKKKYLKKYSVQYQLFFRNNMDVSTTCFSTYLDWKCCKSCSTLWSLSRSGHCLPPCVGSCVMFLNLYCAPVPQDVEQSDHSDHSDITQSTEHGNKQSSSLQATVIQNSCITINVFDDNYYQALVWIEMNSSTLDLGEFLSW